MNKILSSWAKTHSYEHTNADSTELLTFVNIFIVLEFNWKFFEFICVFYGHITSYEIFSTLFSILLAV